jgi:hypothetical protein
VSRSKSHGRRCTDQYGSRMRGRRYLPCRSTTTRAVCHVLSMCPSCWRERTLGMRGPCVAECRFVLRPRRFGENSVYHNGRASSHHWKASVRFESAVRATIGFGNRLQLTRARGSILCRPSAQLTSSLVLAWTLNRLAGLWERP